MTANRASPTLKAVNFAVGLTLLVMLFPIGGVFTGKPAGVRNAIELAGKKTSVQPVLSGSIASA